MSASPLIEAVERAGGTIVLHGDKLRLSAPQPLPDALVVALRQHKAELLAALASERVSRLTRSGSAPDLGPQREALWGDGIARLAAMPPPRTYPERAWAQLIADAEGFLDRWAGQAAGLGWQTWDLFGVHRRAPWHRLDARGLVPVLQGRELIALTDTAAVIRTDRGASLTYHRKQRDPLHPAERSLLWELA